MVSILPKEEGWANTFRNFGEGLSSGYADRSDENAIQAAVSKLGPNASARDVLDAITNTKTYSPKAKQQVLSNYLGVEQYEELKRHHKEAEGIANLKKQYEESKNQKKLIQEKGNAKALLENSEIDEKLKEDLNAKVASGEVSIEAIKEIIKPKKPPASEFEKGMARENVKRYTESEKDFIDSEKALSDLKRIEELNEKLSGPFGYVKAFNPWNPDVSEMSSLGYLAIKPIIKTFNPSGPLAEKKLKQLTDRYAISPTDSSATIEGKVKTLRKYSQSARDLAKKRIKLFQEYEGNPPLGALLELDNQGSKFLEEMISDDLVPKYYSAKNGKQVIPPNEETKQKWIKEGLITDVKH